MPRVRRLGGLRRPPSKMDRPSRLLIFARRRRGMIRPVLYGVVLLGVAGFGLHVARAMRTPASSAAMRAEIGRDAGLRITDIVVEGRDMEPLDQVKAALGVGRGAPLLGFSVAAARQRLERLSFVATASVERRLPGTVLVRLTERRPFAVWQNHDHFVLIDRSGAVVKQHGMTRKDADAFAVLPLVVGPGAPDAAAALVAALAAEPTVRKQVVAAVRVGERRWNLSLQSGAEVLLPEGETAPALRRLAALEQRMHLLERPLIDIDMRLPDRLVVRPKPPAPAPADAPEDPHGTDSDAARRPA